MLPKNNDLIKSFTKLTIAKIDKSNRMANQWIETRLAPLGITMSDFRLVGALLNSPDGINQKKLSQMLNIRPSTLSVAINKLEKKGVILRVPDATDYRVKRIKYLSNSKILEVLNIIEMLDKVAFKGINKKDIDITKRVLEIVIKNFNKKL